MRSHILGLGRRRVVGIAANVEIEVVGDSFSCVTMGCITGDGGERVVGGDDLFGVLGHEVVLRAAR